MTWDKRQRTESRFGWRRYGFTLIELLVVMAIIATLMTIVAPQFFKQHDRAKDTVLRHNLVSLRDAIDAYREDRGKGPSSLEELAELRYLREVPMDPITHSRETWVIEHDPEGGILNVKSGAEGEGNDGTPYASW